MLGKEKSLEVESVFKRRDAQGSRIDGLTFQRGGNKEVVVEQNGVGRLGYGKGYNIVLWRQHSEY